MKTYLIVIGMAVVLVAVLGGVALLSSTSDLLSAEKVRNAELQAKVGSLEQDVATLRETADYYFRRGVDLQSAGNLQEARTAFEAVAAKFPTSDLVAEAQQRLTAVSAAIAKAEADSLERDRRQQEERAEQERLSGTPMDFIAFYAKLTGSGLVRGQRSRLEVTLSAQMEMKARYGRWSAGSLTGIADFDDAGQYEAVLRLAASSHYSSVNCTVTVALEQDGRVHIYRAEGCSPAYGFDG